MLLLGKFLKTTIYVLRKNMRILKEFKICGQPMIRIKYLIVMIDSDYMLEH
jgi:hypothetical protein